MTRWLPEIIFVAPLETFGAGALFGVWLRGFFI